MKTITKGLVGTVAAGAMAMASASPAYARDHDGIDGGDIVAGALILGGIAAVIAATSDNDRDRYGYRDGYGYNDRRGYDDRYYGRRSGNPRDAIELCVRATENQANRYSYGRSADVTDIRDVDRISGGFKVKGRIAVNTRGRDWRRGDARYGRGWNGDYRGYSSRVAGYDSGRFTCKVKYGRVVDVDIDGIRGVR